MNTVDTLRALLRRWYVLVPGLILAGVLSTLVFVHGNVEYERSASMLLLPAQTSLPKKANPFLYISGLGQTADVLVRAVGAPSVLEDIAADHPDAEVAVQRDPASPGPILIITVKSPMDDDAKQVLDDLIERSHTILAHLQNDESIGTDDQVKVIPLTVDVQGEASQKTRILATGAVGVVLVTTTILLAALVESLAGRRRRARGLGSQAATTALPAVMPPSVTPISTPTHVRNPPTPRTGRR